MTHGRSLADAKPHAAFGAPAEIIDKFWRYHAVSGKVPPHRRHDDTVGDRQPADRERLKQRRHIASLRCHARSDARTPAAAPVERNVSAIGKCVVWPPSTAIN